MLATVLIIVGIIILGAAIKISRPPKINRLPHYTWEKCECCEEWSKEELEVFNAQMPEHVREALNHMG